jgi:hypothetical protein
MNSTTLKEEQQKIAEELAKYKRMRENQRKANKKYRESNPEKFRIYSKKYYESNREKQKESMKQYYLRSKNAKLDINQEIPQNI